jgi:hypothetical protein
VRVPPTPRKSQRSRGTGWRTSPRWDRTSINANTTVEPARPTHRTIYLHGPAHGHVWHGDRHADVLVALLLDRQIPIGTGLVLGHAADGRPPSNQGRGSAAHSEPERPCRHHLQPAIEHVQLHVGIPLKINMPARQTITTDVEHDVEGRVRHVEQLETDVKP